MTIRMTTLADMLTLERAADAAFRALTESERRAYVRAHPTGEYAACWRGYRQIGVKEKDGRTVPNCVPCKKKKRSGRK